MKCPFCGKNNSDHGKVCEECGSSLKQINDVVEIMDVKEVETESPAEELEEVVSPSPKKQQSSVGAFFARCGKGVKEFFVSDLKNIGNKEYVKRHKGRYITAGASLLVIVVAIVLAVVLPGGKPVGNPPVVEGDPTVVQDIGTGIVEIGGKEVEVEKDAANIKQASDGTVTYTSEDGSILKLLDKDGKPITLTEALYNYNISPDGTVTYMSDTKEYLGHSVCDLYYYDKATGKAVLIAKNVVKFSNFNSYDGKSVAYTEVTDKGFVLWVIADKTNPAPKKVDTAPDGMTVMSLANNASLLIYEKCEGSKQVICSYDGSKTETIGTFEMAKDDSDPENITYIFNSSNIYLNQSGSEAFILFVGVDGYNAYYKKAGSAVVQLADNQEKILFVAPSFADESLYTPQTRSCIAVYYPVSNFTNLAYSIYGEVNIDIFTYTPGASAGTLLQEGVTTDAFITSDLSTLFYLYGNELSYVSLKGSSVSAPSVIAEDAVVFSSSADGSVVYYINYLMELYKVDRFGTPQKMADSINNTICVTDKAGASVLYYASYDPATGVGELVKRTGTNAQTVASNVHFKSADSTLSKISYYKDVKSSAGGFLGDLYTLNNGKERLETKQATFIN